MRNENRCKEMMASQDGSKIWCGIARCIDPAIKCPKSRNRCIITTACWRIKTGVKNV